MSVTSANFEVRKTTFVVSGIGSLGDKIDSSSAGLVSINSESNLFKDGTADECIAGATKYRIFGIKFLGPGTIRRASLVASESAPSAYINYQWAFDPLAYKYGPMGSFNGTSDFVSVASTTALQLNKFSIMAYFRTSKADYTTDGDICNKGGHGSETAGQNMSYGIYLDANENLVVDFETGAGVNSTLGYGSQKFNDGKIHHVIARYGDTDLRLMVDFDFDNEKSLATTAVPEVNTQPLVIGRNSRVSDRFFEGDIDEVYVYNRRLNDDEIEAYRDSGIVPARGLVYSNVFGGSGEPIAQKLPDENTGPSGALSWRVVNNQVPSVPNVGDMAPNKTVPIIVRRTNIAGTPDLENSFIHFNLHYTLEVGQTAPDPPSPGEPPPGPSQPPDNNPVKIAIGADWGCEDMTDTVVSKIIAQNCDRIIDGGDKSYESSLNCWLTSLGPILSKLIDSIGNHDDTSSIRSKLLATQFVSGKHYYQDTPASYYYVTIENFAIIVMDSEVSFTQTSTQGKAIIQFLTEINANSAIDWTFVTFHRPWVGSDSDHPNNEGNVVQTWMNYFISHKVFAVINAHNHNTEITFPINYNSSDPEDPDVFDSSGPFDWQPGQYLIIIHEGTAGHDSGSSLYQFSGSQPAFIAFRDDEANGYFIIQTVAATNNKSIDISFYSVESSSTPLYTARYNKI